MPATILVVNDHQLFRKGLRLLLEAESDMCVVGEAGDGKQAISRVRELSPDVVVIDITIPNLNGIEVTRHILSEFPDTKVVALSIHAGEEFVQDMLSAGAAGYILKDSAPEELSDGIRKVLRGEVYLSGVFTGVDVSGAMTHLSVERQQKKDPANAHATSVYSHTPVIKTKLYRPSFSEEHVCRPRLFDKLSWNESRPLTLVVAPAGYGKSTLIGQWLTTRDAPSAWYTVTKTDNDLKTFLTYFLTAVQGIFPDAAWETRAMLTSPEQPEPVALAQTLIKELDRINHYFTLVLDEYHVIHDEAIQHVVTELLKHSPRHMHLVLIARHDPPIPLSTYRAQSLMTEIRVRDLRFTVAETADFLQRQLGELLDEATVAALEEKTEGWVTGLRLVALSFHHRSDVKRVLSNLPDNNRYVMDYIVAEVFSLQPPAIQEYLLATSILNRYCAPLCDAVCASSISSESRAIPGEEFIAYLEKGNLFVVPLDDDHRWYRYHHIFRELLQRLMGRRLSPDSRDALYRRASDWFADNGLIEEAFDYVLKSGDTKAAAQLLSKHRHDLMNNECWHQLRRMTSLLPDNALESVPELILLDAWMQWHQMQLPEMIKTLDRVEPLLAGLDPESTATEELKGECNILRSLQYYLEPPFDALKVLDQAQLALQRVPPHRTSQRGLAILMLGHAYQATGNLSIAYSSVFEAINKKEFYNTTYHGRLLMTLGFLHWIEGDLATLKQVAQQMLNLGEKFELPEISGIARYFRGINHYCRNDLSLAEKELSLIVLATNKISIFNFCHSAFALALTYQAQDRQTAANNVADMVVVYSLETNNSSLLQTAHAFKAELALRQGNMAIAGRWASEFDPAPLRVTNRFFSPQPLLGKVLLAQNTPESLHQAAGQLSRLLDFYTAIHSRRYLIDVLLLQALLHDVRGEGPAALSVLERAVAMAQPGEFIRPFLDLGPRMADLLNRLGKQNVDVKYVGKLLSAFRREGADAIRIPCDDQGEAAWTASPPPMSMSLTNRELDILPLLSQRLSNKEIAEKLFLSPKTVKAHLYNIYQKLHVKTRRQAVDKASMLGLLSNNNQPAKD